MDSSGRFEQALQPEMAIVDFEQALNILKSGNVLGLPTETVYGLAARIDSEESLNKIFHTKRRPFFDPLIVHISPSMNPEDYTLEWPEIYKQLADEFWPGPLTLIARKKESLSDLITAGLPRVGLRMPSHPIAQKLITELGVPLAAPSANMFGKTSPTQAFHVEEEFKGAVPVIDGGASEVGLESTVVGFENDKNILEVLRPGMISRDQIQKVCRPLGIKVVTGQSQAAPGQLKTHYQPNAPVILDLKSQSLSPDLIKRFEEKLGVEDKVWKELRLNSDPTLAARELYSQLRDLSHPFNESAIWIPLDPHLKDQSEWEMIFNRLERAASYIFS